MAQDARDLLGTDTFADSYGYLNQNLNTLLTNSSGTSAPPFPRAFQFWADTTANKLKLRNAANDAWIVVGDLGVANLGLLSLSGGTMTGDIDCGTHIVKNLGLGTNPLDAARVQELALKAPLAAPQLTGDAQVNQDPAGNNSITRRSWTEGRYLKLTGGTMTGAITLAAYAGAAYHPTPLEQVQGLTTFSTTAGHRHDGSDARKVRGADLDSGAASTGAVPMAQGGGNSTYVALQQTPVRFLDDPTLVVNIVSGTISSTYQTVDVSANTDTDAYAAILRVRAALDTARTLRMRKQGIATDTSNMDMAPEASGVYVATWSMLTIVELSASRQFQYRAAPSSVAGDLKINLVGYIRKTW